MTDGNSSHADVKDHWLRKNLLYVNSEIVADPTLITCMQHMFDWANEQGLNGVKVRGLMYIRPVSLSGPIQPGCFSYMVECTKEQYDFAQMKNKFDVEHSVLSALKDE